MNKRQLTASLFVVLLLVAGSTNAAFRETRIDYYSDDTFTTNVGLNYEFCNGHTLVGGSVGPWRIFDQYSCFNGARVVHKCQQSDGMGGWFDLACPR